MSNVKLAFTTGVSAGASKFLQELHSQCDPSVYSVIQHKVAAAMMNVKVALTPADYFALTTAGALGARDAIRDPKGGVGYGGIAGSLAGAPIGLLGGTILAHRALRSKHPAVLLAGILAGGTGGLYTGQAVGRRIGDAVDSTGITGQFRTKPYGAPTKPE